MRRGVVLLAAGALALPASAAGKQGAMVSPRLFGLPAGATTQLELYVLPVYRGDQEIAPAAGLPVYRPDGEVIPAPRVGSVPIVILREVGGVKIMRFVGTALDPRLRSDVKVAVPASAVSRRWSVSVRASGHVYPDLTDPPLTTIANLTPRSAASRPQAGGERRGERWWPPPVVALACGMTATVLARVRTRRRGPRQPQSA